MSTATWMSSFLVATIVATRPAFAETAPPSTPGPAPGAHAPAAPPVVPASAPAAAAAPLPAPAPPAVSAAPAALPVPAPPAAGPPATGAATVSPALTPPAPAPELARPAADVVTDRDDWYESLDVSAFVDTYFGLNFNGPKPQDSRNALRAFDRSNGFGISWAALDIAYSSDAVGATLNLRFGPSALVYSGNDDEHGLQYVKQAYATWKPLTDGKLTLDFGKMESIYGLEVSDSQHDINYTRGLVYTLTQPFFFTGLRANYAFSDAFSATLLAVNGWNNSVDNNVGKSFGAQVVYSAPRSTGSGNLVVAKLGYVMGPEQLDYLAVCPTGTDFTIATVPTCVPSSAGAQPVLSDRASANTKGLRHLIDLVVQIEPTEALTLALNADYGRETQIDQLVQGPSQRGLSWYGVAVEGRYGFNDIWATGLRGEYVGDPQAHACAADCAFLGVNKVSAVSGTVTIDAAPANHLLLRLDGRVDHATKDVFPLVHDAKATQWTATLGVVATTN
jgi:hypothetical protein